MEERDSFIFYRSFKEAIKDLNDADRLSLYEEITDYALFNEEKELSGVPKTLWKLIKPQIDANTKRFKDGKKGGRPEKTTGYFQKKPLVNLKKTTGSKNKKPNNNENVNVNENVNENAEENNTKEEDDIFTYVENALGRTLNGIEYETINSWEDNDLTRYAIKESVLSGARGLRYIETVLVSWKAKGFKTVQDVQAYQQKRKKLKNESAPDWFEEESKQTLPDEDSQQEMDKLLEEFE